MHSKIKFVLLASPDPGLKIAGDPALFSPLFSESSWLEMGGGPGSALQPTASRSQVGRLLITPSFAAQTPPPPLAAVAAAVTPGEHVSRTQAQPSN